MKNTISCSCHSIIKFGEPELCKDIVLDLLKLDNVDYSYGYVDMKYDLYFRNKSVSFANYTFNENEIDNGMFSQVSLDLWYQLLNIESIIPSYENKRETIYFLNMIILILKLNNNNKNNGTINKILNNDITKKIYKNIVSPLQTVNNNKITLDNIIKNLIYISPFYNVIYPIIQWKKESNTIHYGINLGTEFAVEITKEEFLQMINDMKKNLYKLHECFNNLNKEVVPYTCCIIPKDQILELKNLTITGGLLLTNCKIIEIPINNITVEHANDLIKIIRHDTTNINNNEDKLIIYRNTSEYDKFINETYNITFLQDNYNLGDLVDSFILSSHQLICDKGFYTSLCESIHLFNNHLINNFSIKEYANHIESIIKEKLDLSDRHNLIFVNYGYRNFQTVMSDELSYMLNGNKTAFDFDHEILKELSNKINEYINMNYTRNSDFYNDITNDITDFVFEFLMKYIYDFDYLKKIVISDTRFKTKKILDLLDSFSMDNFINNDIYWMDNKFNTANNITIITIRDEVVYSKLKNKYRSILDENDKNKNKIFDFYDDSNN